MTEEQEINHGRNIAVLAQDYTVDEELRKYKESYGKEGGDTLSPIRRLTSVLTRGDRSLENLLINAQPQAIENEASNYHTAHKNEVDQAVNETGSQLAESYVAGLDDLVQRVIEEASKQKGFSELSEEQKDAVLRPMIYVHLVESLKDLTAKDEEVAKAQKQFYGLDKAEGKEVDDAVRGYLMRDLGLSSNSANLAETGRVYRESIVPRNKAMLSRFIISRLLKEDDGDYSIDMEKFKEIYGTTDNYRKIAYDFARAAEAAQRQAQREAA